MTTVYDLAAYRYQKRFLQTLQGRIDSIALGLKYGAYPLEKEKEMHILLDTLYDELHSVSRREHVVA